MKGYHEPKEALTNKIYTKSSHMEARYIANTKFGGTAILFKIGIQYMENLHHIKLC